MQKKGISIFLSVIFLLFIATPTIITIVDDTVDISIIFSTSEEENQNHLNVETLFLNKKMNELGLVFTSTENNLGYFFKNYPKPHLNLISPPPEQHIL
ncbi:hypothetical protein ACFS5M_03095 [Lacinutrix iliipiscaria]|uniref:Uncharacterized protein n=1 Tax=Lacinutrix iliipiscaria TaxID=1230532 RepID=A0ABW5WN01_9FLAO